MESKSIVQRRSFLKGAAVAAGAGLSAALLASCEKKEEAMEGPAVKRGKKFAWKLVSSFGPTAPILSTELVSMASELKDATDGDLDIKFFGAGELVPAFGVFDAVKEGSVEMFYSASYYWAGKVPVATRSTTVSLLLLLLSGGADLCLLLALYRASSASLYNSIMSATLLRLAVAKPAVTVTGSPLLTCNKIGSVKR